MKVLHRRCAGLDVHAAFVTVCARLTKGRSVRYEEARFETTTRDLLALAAWLEGHGVTHVVMEATGVYWKPVWHILDGGFELTLANAHEARNLPGRKSDTSDARWLADLLAHGLVRASFVPPGPILALRDLTRTRQQLQRQIVQNQNRIAKVLEDANIKLERVISNLFGVSGRRILEALVAGQTDPERLAALADGRLKADRQTLVDALQGRFTRHHAFLVREHLTIIDHLEQRIAAFEREVDALLAPFQHTVEHLMEIPGVKRKAATAILAEIGLDMSRFASAGHLLSWARLVPRLDESGGKTRSKRVKPGGSWLKPILVQCAWSAVRKKGSYLSCQYASIASRRGSKKAIIAVAGSILTAVYHMVRDGVGYRPPEPQKLEATAKAQKAKRLASQIRSLGFAVQISPTA
jgi:transposase